MAKPGLDLSRAVSLVAYLGNPELNVDRCLAQIDDLAVAAGPLVDVHRSDAERLDALLRFLFDDCGFEGNREAYYDPRNSYLDQVLERRLGIPITLAVVVIEVGRRIGVEVDGVCFPGHFLIRGPSGRILDPFNGGVALTRSQLAEMLGQDDVDHELLRPCGKREILVRILRNLKQVFVNRREVSLAIGTINRLLLLIVDQSAEIRDRGLLFYGSGVYERAGNDLNYYLAYSEAPPDEEAVRDTVRKISQRLNLQN